MVAIRCPSCKKFCKASAEVCGVCGSSLPVQQTVTVSAPKPSGSSAGARTHVGTKQNVKRLRKVVHFAIGAIILVACLIGVIFGIRRSQVIVPPAPPIVTVEPPHPEGQVPLWKPKTAAEQRKEALEAKKQLAEQHKRSAALDAAHAQAQAWTEQEARKSYAKRLENTLLSENVNADVSAIGKGGSTLQLKWALVSKVMAYQFSNNAPQMFQDMKSLGFRKFVITDGYDETWMWRL
jgi:hypothetical protein